MLSLVGNLGHSLDIIDVLGQNIGFKVLAVKSFRANVDTFQPSVTSKLGFFLQNRASRATYWFPVLWYFLS